MGQPVSIPEACTEVRSLLRFYNAHKNPSPDAEWILTATGLRQINLLNPKDVFTANMRWIGESSDGTSWVRSVAQLRGSVWTIAVSEERMAIQAAPQGRLSASNECPSAVADMALYCARLTFRAQES